MAKKQTEEKTAREIKIEILTEKAVPLFAEYGPNLDEVAQHLVIGGILSHENPSISITELAGLLKIVGVNEGFILTKEKKEDQARQYVASYMLESITTFDQLVEFTADVVRSSGAAERWVKSMVEQAFINQGIPVPKEIKLKKWQEAALKVWKEKGSDLTEADLDAVIKGVGVTNYSTYTGYLFPVFMAINEDRGAE